MGCALVSKRDRGLDSRRGPLRRGQDRWDEKCQHCTHNDLPNKGFGCAPTPLVGGEGVPTMLDEFST